MFSHFPTTTHPVHFKAGGCTAREWVDWGHVHEGWSRFGSFFGKVWVHFWWFLWARIRPHLQLYKYMVTQVFAWVTPLQHLKELFIEINQMIITLMTARLHVVPCILKNDTSVHQNMATMGSESTKHLCIKGLTPTCIVLVTWGGGGRGSEP